MKVITLPPGPDPKKETASYSPDNLKEHLLAFLNHNNATGFEKEMEASLDDPTVANLLLKISNQAGMSKKEFKEAARALKSLAGRKSLKYGHCVELLARLYGYRTLAAAHAYAEMHRGANQKYFVNRYYGKKDSRLDIFNPDETKRDFYKRIRQDFPKK